MRGEADNMTLFGCRWSISFSIVVNLGDAAIQRNIMQFPQQAEAERTGSVILDLEVAVASDK